MVYTPAPFSSRRLLAFALLSWAIGFGGPLSAQGKKKADRPARAAAKSLAGPFTNCVGMTLIPIPAGSFTMGSRVWGNEGPMHTVTFARGFHMGQTTVTQGQWEAVMGTRPWEGKDDVRSGPDYPAVYVNWGDAKAFCRALSAKEGRTYRLPSDAEREYAARAGSTGEWCFGSEDNQLINYAWFWRNAWGVDDKYAHLVATRQPNAWGLFDMHGNVWEWCEDVWYKNYMGAPNDGSARVSGGNRSMRVIRGGSFKINADSTRSAYRATATPDERRSDQGFRVVASPRI